TVADRKPLVRGLKLAIVAVRLAGESHCLIELREAWKRKEGPFSDRVPGRRRHAGRPFSRWAVVTRDAGNLKRYIRVAPLRNKEARRQGSTGRAFCQQVCSHEGHMVYGARTFLTRRLRLRQNVRASTHREQN